MTFIWTLRIYIYVLRTPGAVLAKRDAKVERLRARGVLNRLPQQVRAPWFHTNPFFDARDLAQVKYEMLRQVRIDGVKKTDAATLFGVSRPTFYQAEAAFAAQGLAGLLPQQRGPRSPHKLTPEVRAFIDMHFGSAHPPGAREISRAIQAKLGLSVPPRSIERALARKKKQ